MQHASDTGQVHGRPCGGAGTGTPLARAAQWNAETGRNELDRDETRSTPRARASTTGWLEVSSWLSTCKSSSAKRTLWFVALSRYSARTCKQHQSSRCRVGSEPLVSTSSLRQLSRRHSVCKDRVCRAHCNLEAQCTGNSVRSLTKSHSLAQSSGRAAPGAAARA